MCTSTFVICKTNCPSLLTLNRKTKQTNKQTRNRYNLVSIGMQKRQDSPFDHDSTLGWSVASVENKLHYCVVLA